MRETETALRRRWAAVGWRRATRLLTRAPALAMLALWLSVSLSAAAVAARGRDLKALDEQVLILGFNRIAEMYLEPVDLAELTVDGLKGVSALEPALTVQRSRWSLKVMLGEHVLGVYPLPQPDDSAGWASLANRVIERTRHHSPKLAVVNPDDIYQEVFDAITSELDSYSRYSGPGRAGNERAQRDGFGGVGLTFEMIGRRPVVREVVTDAPADRAGVRKGDIILSIDGVSTGVLSASAIRDVLRGPIGSPVTLTLDKHFGYPVTLERERVIPNTIELTLDGRIAHLKLERFNAATAGNLRQSIAEARQRLGGECDGVILDLRGNPGGLLDQAVAVADLFIRSGRIISTAGRHADSWQRFYATSDDILDGRPMVVLIDGRSASASEIVAAALQDNRRALVIGASTFGKGSVQTVTRLPNDGELFLTWSRIYAPSGYTLHRQGVQPTVCTSQDGDTVERIVDALAAGRLHPSPQLAHWRHEAPDDEGALAKLRETCPWKAHEPELDVKVAERVLLDRGLYFSALNMTYVAER